MEKRATFGGWIGFAIGVVVWLCISILGYDVGSGGIGYLLFLPALAGFLVGKYQEY